MTNLDLFNFPTGHRDGTTYEAPLDFNRLNRQSKIVAMAMLDKQWHTLPELSAITGQPEASISARLRDFRKKRFGGHTVERKRLTGGLFAYRLIWTATENATVPRQSGI
jgi:hypothetical protein